MLSNDIQKVAIVNLPKNYLKAENNDGNRSNQVIHVTESTGSFFVLDTDEAVFAGDTVQIPTGQIVDHYTTFRLASVDCRINIPTINERNDNLRIFYTDTVTQVVGTISITIPRLYYNVDTFIAALQTQFSAWHASNSGIFNTPVTVQRLSALTSSPDFHKIALNFPTSLGNPVTFQVDSTCSYARTSKFLAYFDPRRVTVQNAQLVSAQASMRYTRYLEIQSHELTDHQRVPSFDGHKTSSDLVALLRMNALSGPISGGVDQLINFSINTQGCDLSRIHLRIEDEHGHKWPLGVDESGYTVDNQLRLIFFTTD